MLGLAQMAAQLAEARCGKPGAIVREDGGLLPVSRYFADRLPRVYPVSAAYYAIIAQIEVAMIAYRCLHEFSGGRAVGPTRVIL